MVYSNLFLFCFFSIFFLFLMFLLFVLETIRTGAMRVIHVIVKTEETQKLRMKFVLYCSTWIQTQTKKLPFHLSTDRQIWQRVDISTLGLKTWGLRCRRSQKFILQSTTQVKTKRNPTSHPPCKDLSPHSKFVLRRQPKKVEDQTHHSIWKREDCCARSLCWRRSKIRHHIIPHTEP